MSESATLQRPMVSERPTDPPVSFGDVYDAHVDFVWRVIGGLGVRPESVPDVAQEVFVVVHRKLADFEGASSVRTWLFQIARFAVREHRRTARRKEPPAGAADGVDALEGLPSLPQASPEAAAERTQAVHLLGAILEDMGEERREVFVLAELEQLQAPEIAAALGVSVNTVYSRLRQARAAFEQALARHRARAHGWRIR